MQQDIIQALMPFSTKRTIKKHTILLYQGEAPRAAYVLLTGAVKAYSLNQAGEEQIVTFNGPDDIFPASWIFDKSSSTLYYYEALTDCQVLTLPKEDLRRIILENPDFTRFMFDYFITISTGMMMRITALEQSRASEKLMFTLYYLAFRYGQETKPGKFSVDLQLTHSLIAGLVGLTRETTATELSKLKRMKALDYTAQRYIIDKQALERLLGEDNFKDVVVR